MLRDGGKVHGLGTFTDPKAGGCFTLTSAGFIRVPAEMSLCGYGRTSWAGYGQGRRCIHTCIVPIVMDGFIFMVNMEKVAYCSTMYRKIG